MDNRQKLMENIDGLHAKVNVVWEMKSTGAEELDTLLPSVLDRAYAPTVLWTSPPNAEVHGIWGRRM